MHRLTFVLLLVFLLYPNPSAGSDPSYSPEMTMRLLEQYEDAPDLTDQLQRCLMVNELWDQFVWMSRVHQRWGAIAYVFFRANHYDEAAFYSGLAAADQPNNTLIQFNYARYLTSAGRIGDAAQVYLACLEPPDVSNFKRNSGIGISAAVRLVKIARRTERTRDTAELERFLRSIATEAVKEPRTNRAGRLMLWELDNPGGR